MPGQRIRGDATTWIKLLHAHLDLHGKLAIFVDRVRLDRTTGEVVDSILVPYHNGHDIFQTRKNGVGSITGTGRISNWTTGELLRHRAEAPRSPHALLPRMGLTWPANENHLLGGDRTELVPTVRMKR